MDVKNVSPSVTKVGRITHLAQSIKYTIEVYQYFALGNLRNIVHSFAGVVSDSGILIGETGKNGRNNLRKVCRQLIL